MEQMIAKGSLVLTIVLALTAVGIPIYMLPIETRKKIKNWSFRYFNVILSAVAIAMSLYGWIFKADLNMIAIIDIGLAIAVFFNNKMLSTAIRELAIFIPATAAATAAAMLFVKPETTFVFFCLAVLNFVECFLVWPDKR